VVNIEEEKENWYKLNSFSNFMLFGGREQLFLNVQ
jgi:hypothetical protein